MPTIHTIDLKFMHTPQVTAAYVVIGPDGPVLVETGPGSTIDHLVAGLDALGLKPGDIGHLLVTHIHLDHAGAAGWWAQQGAHVYVHQRGARHLIDPARLLASAGRIYGDQMDAMWGPMLPVPEAQLTALYDGDVVQAAGLEFVALETPGHARHHHAYKLGDIIFAGDVAAIRTPGSDLISVPAPPPEFELQAWQASVDRLLAEEFSALYPTHFGKIDDGREHLQALRPLLAEQAHFIHNQMLAGASREQIVDRFVERDRQRAMAGGVSAAQWQQFSVVNPLYMSVDGMMRYWRKKAEAEQQQ